METSLIKNQANTNTLITRNIIINQNCIEIIKLQRQKSYRNDVYYGPDIVPGKHIIRRSSLNPQNKARR